MNLLGASMSMLGSKLAGITQGEAQDDGREPRIPPGRVYYAERPSPHSGQKSESKLCCKVVDVQGFLREHIFSRKTLVAVSATLASGDSFKFVQRVRHQAHRISV